MAKIKVPPDVFVTLSGPDGKEKKVKYSFGDWLIDVVITSPESSKGYEAARRGEKIKIAANTGYKAPGDELTLDDSDLMYLKLATQSCTLVPVFNLAAITFYEAVNEASKS